jgi:hypothetical protein
LDDPGKGNYWAMNPEYTQEANSIVLKSGKQVLQMKRSGGRGGGHSTPQPIKPSKKGGKKKSASTSALDFGVFHDMTGDEAQYISNPPLSPWQALGVAVMYDDDGALRDIQNTGFPSAKSKGKGAGGRPKKKRQSKGKGAGKKGQSNVLMSPSYLMDMASMPALSAASPLRPGLGGTGLTPRRVHASVPGAGGLMDGYGDGGATAACFDFTQVVSTLDDTQDAYGGPQAGPSTPNREYRAWNYGGLTPGVGGSGFTPLKTEPGLHHGGSGFTPIKIEATSTGFTPFRSGFTPSFFGSGTRERSIGVAPGMSPIRLGGFVVQNSPSTAQHFSSLFPE